MTSSVWAIVVAAGRGTRFGGPKQFGSLGGGSVVARSLECVAAVSDGVVVVLPPEVAASTDPFDAGGLVSGGLGDDVELVAVAGRGSRAGSVRAGLDAVPSHCDVVVVHDAARPLATARLAGSVVAAVLAGADGAVPGIGLADTVKRTDGDRVVETLERATLVRVQTPQAFSAGVLRSAHRGEPEATDDAALVEAAGGRVVVVPGEEHNVKITSPADMELVRYWSERLTPERPLPAAGFRSEP